MPLPAGFKVNGNTVSSVGLIPPLVKKVATKLDKIRFGELLTSQEVAARYRITSNGGWICHPALQNYREKVDNKVYWGSQKSIKQLRKKLNEPEETDGKD